MNGLGGLRPYDNLKLDYCVENTVPTDEKLTDNVCAFVAMHVW